MFHNLPKRFVIVYLLILTLVFKQQFILTAAEESVEAKIKEIEKLRAELSGALDAEQQDVASKGIIVQPTWTAEKDQKTEIKTPSKVEVTQERIDEVKALREEIQKSKTPAEETVKKLVKEFESQEAAREALDKLVGSAKNKESEAFVGNADTSNAKDEPNLIHASEQDVLLDIDIRKMQRLELSKRRMRERLILKSVEEDFTFNLGDDVQQWAHIIHNGSEYFVGRREQDLFIARKESATYEMGKVVDVGQPISYLMAYSFWNDEQAQTEGVTLVATGDRILWYRVNNETRNVELYWRWVVGNTITGLTYFTVEDRDYLIVSTNQSSYTGFYMLNIYQFELSAREFWIAQRMQLKFPCVETTLLDTGRDLILAVPQNNTAAIYTFNPRSEESEYLRFKLKQHIKSEGCESVAGFKMGGRSYIAVGGKQPQILLYQQSELVPKTILAHNFGVVQLFFPIPVRTYRDDLILLVQHSVDFSTHSLTVIETLIWDGEAFEASIPVPCKLGEHTVYGVSCMLDVQHDAGLKGATYFRRNDEVSIIVPRRNAESGLFRLHTELLAKNSEYIDLKEIFAFLKDWVKEQDDFIASAQEFLQMTADGATKVQPDLSELNELEVPELILNNGELGEIYVNDYRWTDEDTQLDLNELLTAIEHLDVEVNGARHRRDAADELNFDYLEFESLDVDELFVKQLNGKELFVQEGVLDFDGILNVRDLDVLERLDMSYKPGEGVNETLKLIETLTVDSDIEFESINGMAWKELEDNMIFTNEPLNLSELHVDGEVLLENKVSLEVLNSLNFPDDYLWTSGPTESIVRAEKTFTETLSVNALESEGSLNGLNVSDAITLTDEQEWRGTPTFTELKVIGGLELNGTTRGRDIGNLPTNPTLRDANVIEAICNFRQLQVNGSLLVKGRLDDKPLTALLSDIVQRPSDPETVITVKSKKYFDSIEMPIDFEVLDGKVNGIPADHFVPAHTKQYLTLNKLQAYIYFSNLTLSGRYDGVNIGKLMSNAIKIDEPQHDLDTRLNFMSAVEASQVQVTSSLNGVPIVDGYQTIYEDMNIHVAHFDHLETKEANINGNIKGDNATWNVAQSKNPLDVTENADIYIEELDLQSGLEVDRIQGLNVSLVWTYLDEIDDLLDMVLDGKILVDHVVVTGNVHVNKLNEQRFDEDLQLTIIWLNRPNFLSTHLKFSETLHVNGNLQVEGYYNGHNLQALINDMVFREPTNGTAEVFAPKSFTQKVRVLGDTSVEAINGIHFKDIATKKTIFNFHGSLHLHGNLVVEDLELTSSLNSYPMSTFSTAIRYDRALDTFVLQGVVDFDKVPIFLEDLTVLGDVNSMSDMAQFFDNLVFKNEDCILKGSNTFTGRVVIEKGAYIRHLNGFNLLALLENIVYVNEPFPVVIRSPITFKGSVRAHNLFVDESLGSSKLNDNPLEEWFNDTLRLDRRQEIETFLSFAPGSLDGNSFFVSYLNDIDLSEIVTLYTLQNLTGNITFSELHLDGQIQVNGSVNDVDLQEEYENTLMSHGDQHITTPLTLHSALVRGNVITNAPINNDKDLRELATLQGDQHFESPLFFEDLKAEQLKTKYPVSGINMDAWFQATLHTHGKTPQFIVGNWSARTLTVKSGPTLPSYMNNMRPDPLPFGGLMRSAREGQDYKDACEVIKEALRRQQKRGYYLRYLEKSFELMASAIDEDNNENVSIRTVFPIEGASGNYLLINMENRSNIAKWNADRGRYSNMVSFDSGDIDQVLVVVTAMTAATADTIDFVTNRARTEGALRYWRLEGGNLTLLKTFAKAAVDLMQSNTKPYKFYAVHDDIVYGYDLSLHLHTDTWFLPNFLGSIDYRFVPHHAHGLMFTNGAMILIFGDNDTNTYEEDDGNHADEVFMRDKRTSVERYSLPLSYQRVISPQPYKLSETLLKPNATHHTHHFRLADFRTVIGHILDDMNYRLRLEVNITQLSIPETDLHDEHLLSDTIAVMEELKRQKIYENIKYDNFGLELENPAQILAARTVQILWPNIVNLEEIQGYLEESNDDVGDATVARIMNQLGIAVRDVLKVANGSERDAKSTRGKSGTAKDAHELAAVIERIRDLQDQLQTALRELKEQELEETVNMNARQTPVEEIVEWEEDLEVSGSAYVPTAVKEDANTTQTEAPPNDFVALTLADTTWLKFYNKNLPILGEGEIISILVRASKTPLELWAVTFNVPHIVGTHQHEIILYLDVLKSKRFQTIGARLPRSLITYQIAAETVFAYVEDCCTVRVLVYRGVQGFVEFAHFETSRRVLKIFAAVLQSGEESLLQQPHLGVVHADGVVFYRFVAAGSLLRMPNGFSCN